MKSEPVALVIILTVGLLVGSIIFQVQYRLIGTCESRGGTPEQNNGDEVCKNILDLPTEFFNI